MVTILRKAVLWKIGIFAVILGWILCYSYDKAMFEFAQSVNSWRVANKFVKKSNYAKAIYNLNRSSLGIRNKAKPKVILLWKPIFGGRYLSPKPDDCQGCVITYEQQSISLADAVVFNFGEIRDSPAGLPLDRRVNDQRWVWFCMEPPWNVRYVFQKTLTPLNGIFNWTMTYRRDSDILASHAMNYPTSTRPLNEVLQTKTETSLAAWIVSNCDISSRSKFVEELKKYIPVDIYGKCSGRPLCKPPCQHRVISRYKFYLSLENSKCKDYITEKFWVNALGSHTVPVVMGPPREQYELVAPPDSFIHVDDFASVKDLADYMKNVSEDEALYARYLAWHNDPKWVKNRLAKYKQLGLTSLIASAKRNHSHAFCNLCDRLRFEPVTQQNTVKNLDKWWFGDDYTSQSEQFSVCSPFSGPSGHPLRWCMTLGYTLFFFLLFLCIVGAQVFVNWHSNGHHLLTKDASES